MNNIAVFFCLKKPIGNDNARLPVIVREALTKVRPVGHVVVRATGASFALRWLAFTVDAGLSLRAWWGVYADAVNAGLFASAVIRNAGAALLMLTIRASGESNAFTIFWAKASGTSAERLTRRAG